MAINKKRFPMLLAGGIVIALVLWMVSGIGDGSVPVDSAADERITSDAGEPLQVRVQRFTASEIVREIIVSAQTEPNRSVDLKAEAEGVVQTIGADRGSAVDPGGVILELDLRDRNARLSEATALVTQRELQFNALDNLKQRNFTTEVQIAEAKAALESALASRIRIEQEIRYTRISAPFAGIVNDRMVEIGDFVRVGDAVAQLVDLDPLIVAGVVNEREVAALSVGSKGRAVLVDGTEVEGSIRYLSPVADSNTRSFLVEVAVDNPDGSLRAGQTAELVLSANAVRVHTLSAGLLSLADDGTVGVKVVDAMDTVQFYPVNIVGSSDAGMHVTGLPEAVTVITVGQGFVTEGQRVEPIVVTSPESAASHERAD